MSSKTKIFRQKQSFKANKYISDSDLSASFSQLMSLKTGKVHNAYFSAARESVTVDHGNCNADHQAVNFKQIVCATSRE